MENFNEIDLQTLEIVFSRIHPNIDFNSNEFIENAGYILSKKGTIITNNNYKSILHLCKEFLVKTYVSEYNIVKPYKLYTKNEEKIKINLFICLLLTIQQLIFFQTKITYDSFKVAFDYIKKNIKESYRCFEQILDDCNDLIEVISILISKFVLYFNDENLMNSIILLADTIQKTAHNLKIISQENNMSEEKEWEEKEVLMYAERNKYILINKLIFNVNHKIKFNNNKFNDVFKEAISDMRSFASFISYENEYLELYLHYINGNERKHWYNLYAEICMKKYLIVYDDMNTIGKYLCDNIDIIPIKRILYHSIFYESIALEYAYKQGFINIARKIIFNGYDHYLELSTLYLIFKYDMELYDAIIDDLKLICLERRIREIKDNYFNNYRYIRNLYGDDFCDDFVYRAKISLSKLSLAKDDDPRLIHNRNTPIWAK